LPAVTLNRNTPLAQGCILDLFIRQELLDRSVIDFGRQMTRVPIAEPIQIEDEFDAWYFDRLRGIFDLVLVPAAPATVFSNKWKLSENAQIFYKLETDEQPSLPTSTEEEATIEHRNVGPPSTASLEQFVKGVCENLNNGQAERWLELLRNEDIRTYTHLANLKYSEWNDIRTIPVNARKDLKNFVNLEKQMAAGKKTKERTGGK
jgi:hypothetical protein